MEKLDVKVKQLLEQFALGIFDAKEDSSSEKNKVDDKNV